MANQPKGFSEFIRKRIVALKRKPQTIALVAFAIAFIYYSLNLTRVSDTTAYINLPGMGLAGFATMLFSILLMVCFINAFPHRKKVNIPMLLLMFLLVGIIIYAGIFYQSRITEALTREINPITVTADKAYINSAMTMLTVHRVLLIIGVALVVLLPFYSKALRKINTNVEVAENSGMGQIDISGEDA
jgi:glucan phosphoethanolaminetransferase (alkaline phosphatase superfamily)